MTEGSASICHMSARHLSFENVSARRLFALLEKKCRVKRLIDLNDKFAHHLRGYARSE